MNQKNRYRPVLESFDRGDCPKTKFGAETTTRCRCENDTNIQDKAVRKPQKGVFGQSEGERTPRQISPKLNDEEKRCWRN